MVLTSLMSAVVSVLAWVAIPLPFLSVPFTAQTVGVLMTGPLLGPWFGGLSMLLYLAIGLMGFPVFARGTAGIGVLFGPTGGFLVGFVVCAVISGACMGLVRPRTWLDYVKVILPGFVALFGCGAAWGMIDAGHELSSALKLYVLPFLPLGLAKLGMAATLCQILHQRLELPGSPGVRLDLPAASDRTEPPGPGGSCE